MLAVTVPKTRSAISTLSTHMHFPAFAFSAGLEFRHHMAEVYDLGLSNAFRRVSKSPRLRSSYSTYRSLVFSTPLERYEKSMIRFESFCCPGIEDTRRRRNMRSIVFYQCVAVALNNSI